MPLIKSASPQAFKSNLKAEIAAGRPKNQALAISYRVQDDAERRGFDAGGSVPFYARSAARNIERSGMVHSPTSGRSDQLPANVKSGSFVMPADALSGIGAGNSMAGANALNKLFKMGPYGAAMPHPKMGGGMKIPTAGMMKGRRGFADGGDVGQPVDIALSGGEFVIEPSKVAEIGGGDIERGHALLDKMVQHIRAKTIKTLKRLPKPKR